MEQVPCEPDENTENDLEMEQRIFQQTKSNLPNRDRNDCQECVPKNRVLKVLKSKICVFSNESQNIFSKLFSTK